MKRNFLCVTLLAIALLALQADAQRVYTPERGSAERTAILNALRVPVERDLKQKIVFVTDTFNVQGSWAFVSGVPQTPDGDAPSLNGTKFEGEADFWDNNFFGLLRKTSGKWRVTTYALGCTDVCYADWWRRYRAPKAIFPYTE
jgi:hypothetical protein